VRAHRESRGTYGRPRIHAELAANGWRVGAKRIARLMRRAGVQGVYPRRFRKTTDSSHLLPIAQNHVRRRFSVNEIQTTDQIWAGDITYLRTHEGWLYFAVVLDLASRRVIGWSMASTMQRELVMNAFRSAVYSRQPAPGAIFHSDRGSQYASADFVQLLNDQKIDREYESERRLLGQRGRRELLRHDEDRTWRSDLGEPCGCPSGDLRLHRNLVQSSTPRSCPRAWCTSGPLP